MAFGKFTRKQIRQWSSSERRVVKRKRTVRKTHPAIHKGVALSKFIGNRAKGVKSSIPLPSLINFYYSQFLQLTPGTTGPTICQLKLNSLNAPTNTLSHQPYGRDQYNTFYGQYRVHYAEVTITAVNNSNLSLPVAFGLLLDNDGTMPSPLPTKVERQRGKNVRVMTTNSNSRVTPLKLKVDMSKYWDTDMADDDMGAIFASDPVKSCLAHLWVQTLDELNTAGTNVWFQIEINQYTELTEPLDIVAS